MIENLKWNVIMVLLGMNHLLSAQTTSNVSESSSTMPTNMSSADTETNNNQDSREMRNENLTDIDSTFSKYRRNGIEVDYADRWEDERKNYMTDLTDPRARYEDEFYPYHRERARFNEKIHRVRVQGCPHYSRDVSRDEGITRSGILQGWLGAARAGTRNEDDKRLDNSPFYVTTAVAKTAPSYRNQASNTNKQYGEYEVNNYDKQNGNYLSNGPKYTNGYNKVKGSASKDYYNFQGGNYVDDKKPNSWQSPQDKNNRVVYYEYNLDDSNRRPNLVYYPQNGDHYSSNYDQCELEYDENYRKPMRNQYNRNRYPTTSVYGGNFVPQSRLSTSFNQEPNDRQFSPYYSADDNYQIRNVDRGDTRNSAYDFNLPYGGAMNEKFQFPAVPSTYMPQSQFISEQVPERQDKAEVKPIPFGGHRFNFQNS